jgi:hypothetical protein
VGFGRKVLLAGLFSLVVITIVFAIVRVTVVSKGYTTSHHQAEISWLYFWSFMEFSVGKCISSSGNSRRDAKMLSCDCGMLSFISRTVHPKEPRVGSRGSSKARDHSARSIKFKNQSNVG